jgi:hypothetical protein
MHGPALEDDQVLASAARFFIDGAEEDAEQFDASECYSRPDDVVSRFLKLFKNT